MYQQVTSKPALSNYSTVKNNDLENQLKMIRKIENYVFIFTKCVIRKTAIYNTNIANT